MVMTPTQLAGLPWAGSLGWLEHPADNREVARSNRVGPTNKFFREAKPGYGAADFNG